jgi:signal peptidase II
MGGTAPTKKAPYRPWPMIVAAVFLLGADRWLKGVAWAMGDSGVANGLLGGVLDVRFFLNQGAVFSLPVPDLVFWPLSAAAAGLVVYLLARSWRQAPIAATGLIFVLLGGLSNLVDRVILGGTIDYLIFFDLSAVNLADGMIVGGALAAYLGWRRVEIKPKKEFPTLKGEAE